MKYKAIGFDWGGVINGQPGFVFTQKFCELVGVTETEYKEVYFRHNRAFNAGKPISERELWNRVLADLNKLDMLDAVVQFSAEYRSKKSINKPVLELVDSLRSNGYKTGLLSNNTVEAANMMRSAEIDKHFDAFTVSAEVGLMKPEPAIYKLLCDKLGINCTELVFVDDSSRSLSSAKECGYEPVLFATHETLIKDLQKLKIL